MIDTIRSETGAEKIFYTGFSMGTTTFLAMANTRPEYQEYIHLASLLAPVVTILIWHNFQKYESNKVFKTAAPSRKYISITSFWSSMYL